MRVGEGRGMWWGGGDEGGGAGVVYRVEGTADGLEVFFTQTAQ